MDNWPKGHGKDIDGKKTTHPSVLCEPWTKGAAEMRIGVTISVRVHAMGEVLPSISISNGISMQH